MSFILRTIRNVAIGAAALTALALFCFLCGTICRDVAEKTRPADKYGRGALDRLRLDAEHSADYGQVTACANCSAFFWVDFEPGKTIGEQRLKTPCPCCRVEMEIEGHTLEVDEDIFNPEKSAEILDRLLGPRSSPRPEKPARDWKKGDRLL